MVAVSTDPTILKKNPLFLPAVSALLSVNVLRAAPPANLEAFLEQHCWDCHDDATSKAGLDLLSLQFDPKDPHNLAQWTRVYDRVSKGEMPPKDEDRPANQDLEAFLQETSNPIMGAWESLYKDSGRTIGRRLNPVEYEYTLRDLLKAPWLEIKEVLPPDPFSHGFDNVADAQNVSYIQMAQFLEASGIALDRAMLLRPNPEAEKTRTWFQEKGRYLSPRENGKKVKISKKEMDAIPIPEWIDFVSQPNNAQAPRRIVNSSSKAAGYYKFRVRCRATYKTEEGDLLPEPKQGQVAWINSTSKRILGSFDVPEGLDGGIVEFTAWNNVGEGLEFFCATVDSPQGKGVSFGDAVGISWFEIDGPYPTEECVPGPWPSYQSLFGDLPVAKWTKQSGLREPSLLHLPDQSGRDGADDPYQAPVDMTMVVSKDPKKDAARLLKDFMHRAYRKAPEPAEFERCLSFAIDAIEDKYAFQDAMRLAYKAVLCSPDFLYFIEDPGKLESHALASRLSYFLWRSMPDEELVKAADSGKLQDEKVLIAQLDRMLADPKSKRFIDDFTGQWLNLRAALDTTPDRDLYPEYFNDTHVVLSAVDETEATFAKMVAEDLPISTVVDSDFALINERLAEVYGIEGVRGSAIREVKLPEDSPRGGLITQSSIMKVTANGLTTSPVLRGVWVLDRILGNHPPPPPPGAGSIDPDTRGATTVREQLAKHSTSESCASCHVHIDPPGFALESFDVMGAWRDNYRANGPIRVVGDLKVKYMEGPEVDPSGQIEDGISFENIHGFKKYLLSEERQVARNLIERLITFSTGTAATFADRDLIESILANTASSNHGLRSVIKEIVLSDVFRKK